MLLLLMEIHHRHQLIVSSSCKSVIFQLELVAEWGRERFR